MSTSGTLLCIHRDPTQLNLLQESGYQLATATNGSDGLRLFMSQHVDAVVLEYHLGLLDGCAVADEIKQVRPNVPIVLLTDHLELSSGALKSVDALVVKSDGQHFLLATVHFVLSVKPAQSEKNRNNSRLGRRSRGARALSRNAELNSAKTHSLPKDSNLAPFSREIWRGIRRGIIQF